MASVTEVKRSGTPTGTYLARVRVKGVGEASKVFASRVAAQAWGDRVEREMKDARAVNPDAPDDTFEQLAQEYLQSTEWAQRKEKTKGAVLRRLQHDVLPELGHRRIAAITYRDMLSFRDKLLRTPTRFKTPPSPDHVRLVLAAAAEVFNWAVHVKRVLDASPASRLRLRAGRRRSVRVPELTKDIILAELQSLRGGSGPKAYTYYVILSDTGARPGEIAALRWRDVSFKKRMLTVEAAKDSTGVTPGLRLTKHLTETGARVLWDYWEAEFKRGRRGVDFVFPSIERRTGAERPYDWRSPIDAVRARNEKLRPFTASALRHEFVSRLFEAPTGLSDVQIQQITGHRSLQALAGYAHLRSSNFAPVLEKVARTYREIAIADAIETLGAQVPDPGDMT